MGATTFYTRAKGKTAEAAFKAARDAAKYTHGHGGYTGTIAEKTCFTMITVPTGQHELDFARSLIDAQDPRVDDKYGPAGCVKVAADDWLFFGWASE